MRGEPTRVQVLYGLSEAGEPCVCNIAAAVDTTQTSMSHALQLLRAADIGRNGRSGRMVCYSLDDPRPASARGSARCDTRVRGRCACQMRLDLRRARQLRASRWRPTLQ